MWYVYILECKNDSFYIGCTNNLKHRIERHKKGYVGATKSRLPAVLKNFVVFQNKHSAYKFEKYLKSGSGRAFLKKHLL